MMPYETIERGSMDDVLKEISKTGSQSSSALILDFVSRGLTTAIDGGWSVGQGSVVHHEEEEVRVEVRSCFFKRNCFRDSEVYAETEGTIGKLKGPEEDGETGFELLSQGGDTTGRRDTLTMLGAVEDGQLYQDMQAVKSPAGALRSVVSSKSSGSGRIWADEGDTAV
jgi:hypothetical protein